MAGVPCSPHGECGNRAVRLTLAPSREVAIWQAACDDPRMRRAAIVAAVVALALIAVGGAGALVLDRYGSELTVQSGGRAGIAINTVQVSRAGRYRLQAAGAATPAGPAVVLGEPSGGRVLRLVLGIIVLVLGGLIGIAAIVLAVVAHTRRSGTREAGLHGP